MDHESLLLAAINELRLAEQGTIWVVKDTLWEKAKMARQTCHTIPLPVPSISLTRMDSP